MNKWLSILLGLAVENLKNRQFAINQHVLITHYDTCIVTFAYVDFFLLVYQVDHTNNILNIFEMEVLSSCLDIPDSSIRHI